MYYFSAYLLPLLSPAAFDVTNSFLQFRYTLSLALSCFILPTPSSPPPCESPFAVKFLLGFQQSCWEWHDILIILQLPCLSLCDLWTNCKSFCLPKNTSKVSWRMTNYGVTVRTGTSRRTRQQLPGGTRR